MPSSNTRAGILPALYGTRCLVDAFTLARAMEEAPVSR